MSLTLTTVYRNLTFDGAKVMKRWDRANMAAFSRFGAFVRRDARSSLRRTKKSSSPNEPPRVHSKDSYMTLKNIRFHVDHRQFSVIIGPLHVRQAHGRDVPKTLEHGGTAWVTKGRGENKQRKLIRIEKRPYMRRAFQRVIQNDLPKIMRGNR